jgi:hypothetical protein
LHQENDGLVGRPAAAPFHADTATTAAKRHVDVARGGGAALVDGDGRDRLLALLSAPALGDDDPGVGGVVFEDGGDGVEVFLPIGEEFALDLAERIIALHARVVVRALVAVDVLGVGAEAGEAGGFERRLGGFLRR